jgi:hypothetical protein
MAFARPVDSIVYYVGSAEEAGWNRLDRNLA